MPIQIECLECGEEYRVPDRAAGRRIRCKGCGEPIAVPGKRSQTRPQRRQRDDFDDEDEFDEPVRRRRPKSTQRRQSKSSSSFRWGPLVALLGIPLLFIGFFAGGQDNGLVIGLVLMNIAFGVSSAISTVQKGHPVGLGIPLAFIGLLGLLVVAFLPDNRVKVKTGKNRRR